MTVLLKQLLQKNSPPAVIRHCANKPYNLHPLFKPLTGRQILPFNTVSLLLDNESCCSGENKAKRGEKMDLIPLISHLSTERENLLMPCVFKEVSKTKIYLTCL